MGQINRPFNRDAFACVSKSKTKLTRTLSNLTSQQTALVKVLHVYEHTQMNVTCLQGARLSQPITFGVVTFISGLIGLYSLFN